jgi:hypothetical protein
LGPEEAYIEVPARNIINIYIRYIPEAEKFKFFKFFARKALVGIAPAGFWPQRAKTGGGIY